MAIETPARIAVLGAGPIGLEAALYGRFLGYDVDVYERGRVGENVLRWGHVRLFSPFGMNASSLGLAALAAQDSAYRPPAVDELLTGREFVDRYLVPLSQTDLLIDSLRLQTEVLSISRGALLKGEHVGSEDRENAEFLLLLRDASGREQIASADAIIDATGTYGQHNWAGIGGMPAIGEIGLASEIEYGVPDVLGQQRQTYAGRHTLLIGSGYSAATTVVALAELAQGDPNTSVTWITRTRSTTEGPIAVIAQDRLSDRQRLAERANQLALSGTPLTYRPAMLLSEIVWDTTTSQFHVRLAGERADALMVDRIVANVGYRPNNRLWSELQVHECYATGGPMKLAAALMDQTSADCLDQESCGPQALLNPEPDFYVLGAKSYGRDSRFLISAGLEQIRDLFTILADRAELDLYANMAKLRS